MKAFSLRVCVLAAIGLSGHQNYLAAETVAPAYSPDQSTGRKLDLRQGLRIYKSSCAGCHATGKDGAPRLQDAEAWRNRSFQSFSVMQQHARNGFLLMPAKGRHPVLTDQDVANAVLYMKERISERAKK